MGDVIGMLVSRFIRQISYFSTKSSSKDMTKSKINKDGGHVGLHFEFK